MEYKPPTADANTNIIGYGKFPSGMFTALKKRYDGMMVWFSYD